MNISSLLCAGAVALVVAGLSACSPSGSSEEGIHAQVVAVAQGTTPPHAHEHAFTDGAATPKHTAPSFKTFRRGDGMKIDLQLGLLNLMPVELQSCGVSVSGLLDTLGGLLVGKAHAHAGHGGEAPAGAINVVAEDGTEFDLGSLLAGPGRYCGLVVALQPGMAAVTPKHGDGLDTDMSGTSVNVAPCYYTTTVGMTDEEAAAETEHLCIQARFQGPARTVSLPFAPVTLDHANRHLRVTVTTHYESWFDDIDMTLLAEDADQQRRLAENVEASLEALTAP